MVAGEFRVKHADGSWRWIEAVGKNLLDDPAVGGVVVNYRDITDAQGARGRAPAPGVPRLADRSRQPRPVRRSPRARPLPVAAGAATGGRPVRRPRRFQDDQRQPRPRRGRRDPASASRSGFVERSATATRSPGWAATSSRSWSRTRPRRRPRPWSPSGWSPPSRRRSRRAARSCSSTPASGSRC